MDESDVLRQIEDQLRAWRAERAPDGVIDPNSETIDSLEGLELVLDAERLWGVKIPDHDLGKVCRSIRRLATAIQSRLPQQEPEGSR